MKQTLKAIAILSILISAVFTVTTKVASAATYQPGCYVTSQGSSYQKVSCPNSSPDDAMRYASGCWVSVSGSNASTPYKQFDCASGGQTDAQKKADCEASGGQWKFVGTADRGSNRCESCPAGKTTNGSVCQSTGTDGGAINGGASSASAGSSGLSALKEPLKTGEEPAGVSVCGSGKNEIEVSFDFGCLGPAYGKELNPILDIAFALFRFLSAGVGLVVIGSIIIAGIQYSASRGNPQSTQAAIKRITNAIIGLLIYIFAFAILNFIVPGGLFI